MRNLLLLVCFVLAYSFFSKAQANTGKKVYEAKCATCHSNTAEVMSAPFLHGQEKRFLLQALNDFKTDKRKDELMYSMNNISKNLTAEEVEEVTNYLAASDPCEVQSQLDYQADGWLDKFRSGQELAKNMNCMHCHGSYHHAAPRLYGQKKSYFKKSISAFAEDRRPGFFKMIQIAKALTEDQIEDLSHYFNGMILMRDCQGY